MIGARRECLRFSDIILRRTAAHEFEIVAAGRALARIAVEQGEFPALTVTRLEAETRALETEPEPAAGRIALTHCEDGDPHCFRLTAEHDGERLLVLLRGDSRRRAGRHHFHVFCWRAEFRLRDGELAITGPSLEGDCWS